VTQAKDQQPPRARRGDARPSKDTSRGTPNDRATSTSRGRRTRSALITAAREVFEEVGFKDARVADIAAKANTSYGSFYFYYDSKEAIFRDVVTEFTGQMFQVSRAESESGTDPIERISAANRAYLRAYAQNARLMGVIEEVSPYHGYFRDLMLEIRNLFVRRNEHGIRRLQDQGLADPHLDPVIAASALGGMVERFAQVWLLMGEPYDENAAVETLTRLWAQGIGLAMPAPKPKERKAARPRAIKPA
jgi:AcrR family transcriptional regulator